MKLAKRKLTNLEKDCLRACVRGLNNVRDAQDIGDALQVQRLSIYMAMRRLALRGMVASFSSDNTQWAVPVYFLPGLSEKRKALMLERGITRERAHGAELQQLDLDVVEELIREEDAKFDTQYSSGRNK